MAGHRASILNCSGSNIGRNRRTSSPSNARLLELPPTRRRHPSAFPFRLLLRGGPEQCLKTLGFEGTAFNIRVVGGEVPVVDGNGGGGGLCRLRATLPHG
jgi:hypothetical protein